jgi:hypothetical protein
MPQREGCGNGIWSLPSRFLPVGLELVAVTEAAQRRRLRRVGTAYRLRTSVAWDGLDGPGGWWAVPTLRV